RTGTATTPLGFGGEYTDAESGLLYLRARSYDPATAQFLTRDAITSLTREPYVYAGDDPVNEVDPTGDVKMHVGEVVYTRGTVEIRRYGETEWKPAPRNTPVNLFD